MNGDIGLKNVSDYRVTRLVICGELALLFADDRALLRSSDHDLYHSVLDIVHTDE